MWNRMLVAMFTAAFASVWLPMAAASQQAGQRAVIAPSETVRPPKRPAPVSDAARTRVLQRLALRLSLDPKTKFSLSPNHPYVANRGRLNLRQPILILTGPDESAFLDAGYVDLVINASAKGQRFLAECAVSCHVGANKQCSSTAGLLGGFSLSTSFTVQGVKPGTGKQEFSSEPGGQHLLPVLEAFQPGENRYRISAGVSWWFHSCEISPL